MVLVLGGGAIGGSTSMNFRGELLGMCILALA